MMASVTALEPFVVDVPQDVLTDLAERLRRTRFPDEIAGIGWQQGMPLDYLREIVRYWLDDYDWRVHEARLNRYQQFITTVDGQRIHFLHVRSRHQAAVPLFLTHGWPGSVVEFLDVIDPLADPADPADAFHLVVPSLPGYGFSGPTTETGWNPRRIAAAFGQIADRLGYQRYGVQGGDWGAIVSSNMAELRPDRTIGLHVNLMNVPPPRGQAAAPPTAWARRAGAAGGGYEAIQGTRPQTIGYLLDDSPAGLAAWIIEKFHEWTDRRRRGSDLTHGPAADQRDALLGQPRRRVVGPAVLGAAPGTGDDGAAAAGDACRPGWPTTRESSSGHCGRTPSASSTSRPGPSFPAAGTSRRWRCLTSSWRTCGRSSGRCASRGPVVVSSGWSSGGNPVRPGSSSRPKVFMAIASRS